MLFIQKISIEYYKDVRFASFANQRRAIKFYPVDISQNPHDIENVFFTAKSYFQTTERMEEYPESYKLLGDRAFYDGRGICNTYGGKIAVTRSENGGYNVMTYLHKWKDYYHTCFELCDGEYGRVICNDRHGGWEENWRYELTTFNFIVGPADIYREKMFFNKQPDKEYDDRKYLRYSMG